MSNQKSSVMGNAPLVLGILLLGLANFSPVLARSGGEEAPCSACHTGGTATLEIMGFEEVTPGSTNTYELIITDSLGDVGGLNVSLPNEDAILGLADGTDWIGAGEPFEFSHTSPKDFDSGGQVSWLFTWDAPLEPGSYTIEGWGVSAQSPGGTSNDLAGSTSFIVQVIPVPAAAILFGSALGVLGWVRRRAAS